MLDVSTNPVVAADNDVPGPPVGRADDAGMQPATAAPGPSSPAAACVSDAQMQEFHALALAAKATDEVAQELSAALGMAHQIRARGCGIDLAYPRLKFIFDCLLAEPAKLILARDERLRLQMDLYQHAGWLSRILARISSGSSAALVLAALVASLLVWGVISLAVYALLMLDGFNLPRLIFFMDGKALIVITSAAFLGGVVSIATRLREFSKVTDLDPWAMFWTAMLKPLVGVVLSLFILVTLAGGVVSFGFLDGAGNPMALVDGKAAVEPAVTDKVLYVLWMLGFLAGFSERFAWDFVDRASGVAEGGGPKPK